jgi:hypothetical protein
LKSRVAYFGQCQHFGVHEIPDPPRGLVAQLPLVFTFGAASFGSVETNETNVRLHVEEPDRVAVDYVDLVTRYHFRAGAGDKQTRTATISTNHGSHHSGTFSGTLRPFATPYVPFDPLAFWHSRPDAARRHFFESLILLGFSIVSLGDPSRIRTCNPRSRNPLLYPVELWDRRGDPRDVFLALPI